MFNMVLFKREMKGSIKLLIIFCAIITMYVSIIINMYDPQMMKTLDSFAEVMPELMASVGMKTNATSLLGFMVSYLYGFILLIFPMLFCILRGNALIAKYVDKGSMASLAAAPVKRRTVAFTQMIVLVSGILLLILYSAIVELICAKSGFPGELGAYAFFLPVFFLIPNIALHLERAFRHLCMYYGCLQMLAEMPKKQSISLFLLCFIQMA